MTPRRTPLGAVLAITSAGRGKRLLPERLGMCFTLLHQTTLKISQRHGRHGQGGLDWTAVVIALIAVCAVAMASIG